MPFSLLIGDWEMTITETNHDEHKFKGSMCGGVAVDDTDLTDYIRAHIPVDDLFVFGGGYDEDDEN